MKKRSWCRFLWTKQSLMTDTVLYSTQGVCNIWMACWEDATTKKSRQSWIFSPPPPPKKCLSTHWRVNFYSFVCRWFLANISQLCLIKAHISQKNTHECLCLYLARLVGCFYTVRTGRVTLVVCVTPMCCTQGQGGNLNYCEKSH